MLKCFEKERERYLNAKAAKEEEEAKDKAKLQEQNVKRKTGQSEATVELVEDDEEPVKQEVSAPGALKPVVPHIPERESTVTTYDDEGKPEKSKGATPLQNGGFTDRYSWT